MTGSQSRESFTPGQTSDSSSNTRGKSRMHQRARTDPSGGRGATRVPTGTQGNAELGARAFALAAPGIDPCFDLLVGYAFPAINGTHGFPDTRHLPFVHIEVFVERLCSKKRSTASGTLCKFL